MRDSLHVLHVVESWGGGVAPAVLDYVRSTPQHRHSLLARVRVAHDPHEDLEGTFLHRLALPAGPRASVAAVADAYAQLQPDVVHAHSSYAGAYVRGGRAVPTDRIVYTPHCYAFERLDLPAPARAAFRAVERVLSRRTAAVAAVSPREAELARGLGGPVGVTYVPNIVRVAARSAAPPPGPFVVAAAGRLSPQKDPSWYAAVAAEARRLDPAAEVRWEWVGGEPSDTERHLVAAGVHVTGWLPRAAALQRLQRASVYVHSARWEGAPLTVLEAAAFRLPVVARDIPALRSLDVPGLVADPAQAAQAVLALRDRAAYVTASDRSAELAARHAPEVQAPALAAVYEAVSGGRSAGVAVVPGSGSGRVRVGRARLDRS